MKNCTVFFYMKVLDRIQQTKYDFHHTLFHLHRFLQIQHSYQWERLFVFQKDGVRDDEYNQIMRLLLHHQLIDFERKELTTSGKKQLLLVEKRFEEESKKIDDFFVHYKGENAYQKSCFEKVDYFTVSCHLCENFSCQKKESLLEIFKPSFRLKNPYKSFSL